MEATNKEFVPKHYSIVNDIGFFIRYYRKYEPIVLGFCAVQILLESLLPLLGIWLPKLTIDLVLQGVTISRAVTLLGGFTLLMMGMHGLSSAVMGGKYNLYNTQRTNILGLIFLKSLRIKYEDAEAGEIRKLYQKACDCVWMGDMSAVSRMLTGTTSLCVNILSFLLYSTVIGTLSLWMLLALIGLSFINYGVSMLHIRYEESLREESARVWRHYGCVRNAMGNPYGAKDVRIFGMKRWLLKLRDMVLEEMRVVQAKSSRKNAFYEKIGYTLSAVRDLGAYAYLLYQAANHALTASELVLYFGAITGFSGFVNQIMSSLAQLRGAANDTDYLRAYLELPEEDRTTGSRHIEELEYPLSIEFRDVSFGYKHWENEEDDASSGGAMQVSEERRIGKRIFEHLNLTIHAGEKIALVGANGAGKTTLVKLLCGMYDPDEGQILINGIDRDEFSREELYRLFSVVFQETLILPFTVGENLSLGRAELVDDERSWEVLEKAGLKSAFEEKGIGIRSYMTRQMMEKGVELSGGQKQRFLLARALYKDAPILILDEPTAALDPIAESQVYDNYNKYSQGKTAIFISHRLASTRFSDRIVLIENGRILEMGTHDELMKADGAYAEMFHLQSSYYTESEGGDDDGNGFDE